jgi:hypothetical protein
MSRTALRLYEEERAEDRSCGGHHSESMQATLAVVCRVPSRLPPHTIDDWLRPVTATTTPVTWAVSPEDFGTVGRALAEQTGDRSVALFVPTEWWTQRSGPSLLRRRFEAARRMLPGFDSLVIETHSAPPPGLNPLLLADHGIRAVCSDGDAIAGGRSNRRPAPRGWACRSPAWGLWEFRFGRSKRVGLLDVLRGFVGGPTIPAGSLTILPTGGFKTVGKRGHGGRSPGMRPARQAFERTVQWAARATRQGRTPLMAATLSDVSATLSGRRDSTGTIPLAA